MKKFLICCSIIILSGGAFIFYKNNIPELKNAKYIESEKNDLGVYEYIHELTHSFVNTNNNSVQIIAPTKEARELGSTLCENEIYMKGDIESYKEISHLIDKVKYGIIDNDIIKLHNLTAKHIGKTNCTANSLNDDAIKKIINNDKFFDNADRENFNNTKK